MNACAAGEGQRPGDHHHLTERLSQLGVRVETRKHGPLFFLARLLNVAF